MQRIRDSFDRQGFIHGLFHGGVVASLADVACGYAALSVMPVDREVLAVEFKIHFLNDHDVMAVDATRQGRASGE